MRLSIRATSGASSRDAFCVVLTQGVTAVGVHLDVDIAIDDHYIEFTSDQFLVQWIDLPSCCWREVKEHASTSHDELVLIPVWGFGNRFCGLISGLSSKIIAGWTPLISG